MYIKKLEEVSENNTESVGGKAKSLGKMKTEGFLVPSGFVLLTDVFKKFIEVNDLKSEIDTALEEIGRDELKNNIEKTSNKIQGLIVNGSISSEIKSLIISSFEELEREIIIVRSSASAEDGKKNSWAGQLQSFLGIAKSNLIEGIKRSWASLFSSRAISYRFENNLQEEEISIAVIIQELIKGEISGVAFSSHPVSDNKNKIVIEAGFGLGDVIVNGKVNPDTYLVDKDNLKLINVDVGKQEKAHVFGKNTGVSWKNLPESKSKAQVLEENQIIKLAKTILEIENYWGFPVDVEWTIKNNKVYILQSRPITTF